VRRTRPSQGTGKEYIGDDATSMAEAVQQALRQCALQLKTKLARAQVRTPNRLAGNRMRSGGAHTSFEYLHR
jgi:hypothetical protein